MQAPPLVILQFAPGEAYVSVKKAGGNGACAATSGRKRATMFCGEDSCRFLRYATWMLFVDSIS